MRRKLKTVGVDNDITIEEPIRFVIETKDIKDCPVTPYRIDSVTVYFVSREFSDTSATSYEIKTSDSRVAKEYEQAKAIICARKKDPVVLATTGPVLLKGLQVVDGVHLGEGDRILVKNQADESENGIYIATSSDWSRAEDSRSFTGRAYVFVEEGIANIGSGWYLEAGGFVEVGSTPLKFVKFSDNGEPQSPDQYSELRVDELRKMKAQSTTSNEFYYKNAVAVKVFGGNTDPKTGEFFPAWLNPDMVPSELKEVTASNNILYPVYDEEMMSVGKFELTWDPSGCREGDYFVCWSWRPTLSSDTMSAHMYFSLGGGVGLTASIPTHRTDQLKYNMLLDRYTPETFKNLLSDNDLTPMVVKGLNESVAAGFTMLENLANQIIDLLDANATHEQLLPLLSNMFALKIKSSDPTLWRRQIKKAITNFKKKGTIVGLREAYGDAGMRLLRLSRLWQVVSEHTFQEHFSYEGSSSFDLKNRMMPVDSDFRMWFRPKDGEWKDVTARADELADFNGSSVEWKGEIQKGDSIRVLYKTKEIPSSRRAVENYIKTLPLMDNRDERNQEYPPKNWNVRVIEEDDPMFNALIPVRHPLADPIVWGRIRTEFPYSENAYNMDEYNGSKRDSLNPCDIHKEFVDPCEGCQASVYNIDLEVEGLSDGGFVEATQIAEEYMPFHSIIHTFNLSGSRTEFVGPVEERIEALVTFSGGDTVIAGEAQHIFNKDVDFGQIEDVRRDVLSNFTAVSPPGGGSSWSGTIKNSKVCLYPSASSSESDINNMAFKGATQGFDAYNINTLESANDPFQSGNLLELLGSSTKYYTLSSISPSSAEIKGEVDSGLIGPLVEYRVSNKISDIEVDISQKNRIVFSDDDADFYLSGMTTQRDIDCGVSTGPSWSIKFENKQYPIIELLPDGTLLLGDPSAISALSGWELWGNGEKKSQGYSGSKTTHSLGFVSASTPGSTPVASGLRVGDYVCLGWPSSVRFYRVRSIDQDLSGFYIEGYDEGDVGGIDAKTYRRILQSKVGQIAYEGIELKTELNLESLLPISNGKNSDPNNINSLFLRENYLIFIGSDYYTISHIDGLNLVLFGRLGSYGKSGEEVDFTVYRFSKQGLSLRERSEPPVPGFNFDFVDRSGKALIKSTQADVDANAVSAVLNSTRSGQPFDFASQEEQIEFSVEYKDGERK